MAAHFKVTLETGKKRSENRILFVKAGQGDEANGILHAYTIGKKIRDSRIVAVIPVSYEAYMKGVDKKYSTDHPEVY